MIPEEVKRAAEDAYRETLTYLRLNERGPFKSGSHHRRALHAALEAAAPHLLAPRYDLGGFLDSGVSQVVNTTGKPIAIQTDPYRSHGGKDA